MMLYQSGRKSERLPGEKNIGSGSQHKTDAVFRTNLMISLIVTQQNQWNMTPTKAIE